MRFEARHKDFKSNGNVVKSRRNIAYTLAIKKQLAFSSRILSDFGVRKEIELGPILYLLTDLALPNCWSKYFPCLELGNIVLVSWVQIFGTQTICALLNTDTIYFFSFVCIIKIYIRRK